MSHPEANDSLYGMAASAKPWYWRLLRLLRATSYMCLHIAVAVVLIGGLALLNIWLYEVGDPRFLDFVPVRYIFDLMGLAILVVFGVFGVRDTIEVFREEE